ncbi:hypothetical protein MAR_001204 [Mya arenaria]|uniref:Uncharacterized protein n=1 Tax=Mya arenaria TaxID=6604 RepID=A0ABY7FEI7_MYAAR|nr:hypothetical protein MAR_001204 [Mya arenaria]
MNQCNMGTGQCVSQAMYVKSGVKNTTAKTEKIPLDARANLMESLYEPRKEATLEHKKKFVSIHEEMTKSRSGGDDEYDWAGSYHLAPLYLANSSHGEDVSQYFSKSGTMNSNWKNQHRQEQPKVGAAGEKDGRAAVGDGQPEVAWGLKTGKRSWVEGRLVCWHADGLVGGRS